MSDTNENFILKINNQNPWINNISLSNNRKLVAYYIIFEQTKITSNLLQDIKSASSSYSHVWIQVTVWLLGQIKQNFQLVNTTGKLATDKRILQRSVLWSKLVKCHDPKLLMKVRFFLYSCKISYPVKQIIFINVLCQCNQVKLNARISDALLPADNHYLLCLPNIFFRFCEWIHLFCSIILAWKKKAVLFHVNDFL